LSRGWCADILSATARWLHRPSYVLIGGAALNLHGLVRATEDADVCVRPTADNVERIRQALRSLYGDPSIDEIRAEDLSGEYPAVRYYPPTGSFFIDILARLGEFARYEDIEWQEIEVEGVRIRLATPAALYWLKRGTLRPVDQADAAALREKFGLPEEK
jgi:hypothetical protein